MKIFLFPLLFLTTSVFSQPIRKTISAKRIIIDTIKFTHSISGVINAVSLVPQVRGNSYVALKINKDLKKYFIATSMGIDSVAFMKRFLDIQGVNTLEEYKKRKSHESNDKLKEESVKESFEIKYLSGNMINISISKYEQPYEGQVLHGFNSVCYDLNNGNKLSFRDFLDVSPTKLIELIKKEGYAYDYSTQDLNKIELPNTEVDNVVNYSFPKDSVEVLCTDYYFIKINNEIHLQFYFNCSGPEELFGISLSKLNRYVKYYDFKNTLKLYGKDIAYLIGTDHNELGNKIDLNTNSFQYWNGYFMEEDSAYPHLRFGISKWFSKQSLLFIFMQQNDSGKETPLIITDVMEIKNDYLKDKIFRNGTYEGYFKSINPEIFATLQLRTGGLKKIKEWKGNRKTGKFEVIDYP